MKITDFHPDYEAQVEKVKRARDAMEGGDQIKKMGEDYLPKPESMKDPQYRAYKKRARWYDVSNRTRRGLAGVVLRKPHIITAPDPINDALDMLSAAGDTFDVMAKEILLEVLAVGRYGVQVEMPSDALPGEPPVWAGYITESIINWTVTPQRGRRVLSRVVLAEDNPDDPGEKQYRELFLAPHYRVRIWRKGGDGTSDNFVAQELPAPTINKQFIPFIPFIFFGAEGLGTKRTNPPLDGLIEENIGHYQLSADLRLCLFLCASPTNIVTGATDQERPKNIGSGNVWYFQNENAKAFVLEFSGQGIDAIRQEMRDAEDRMVKTGAQFFERQKAAAEAAQTVRQKHGADGATLHTLSDTLAAGMEACLLFTAMWMSVKAPDLEVVGNKDFLPEKMDPQMLTALLSLYLEQTITFDDFILNLQQGEIVPANKTPSEIRAQIETDPPPGMGGAGEDDDDDDDTPPVVDPAQADAG